MDILEFGGGLPNFGPARRHFAGCGCRRLMASPELPPLAAIICTVRMDNLLCTTSDARQSPTTPGSSFLNSKVPSSEYVSLSSPAFQSFFQLFMNIAMIDAPH